VKPLLPPLMRVPAAFLAALALMTAATEATRGTPLQFWQPLTGIPSDRYQAFHEFVAEEGMPDVVFLGTSLTLRGLSADHVEARMQEDFGGRFGAVWNLGSYASTIRLDRVVLRDLLLKEDAAPRLLVIEVGAGRLNRNNDFHRDWLRFYAQVPDIAWNLGHGEDLRPSLAALGRGLTLLGQWLALGPARPGPLRRTIDERKCSHGSWYGPTPCRPGQDDRWLSDEEELQELLERFQRAGLQGRDPRDLKRQAYRNHAVRLREDRLVDFEIDEVMEHEWSGILALAASRGIRILTWDPPQDAELRATTLTPPIEEAWRAWLRERGIGQEGGIPFADCNRDAALLEAIGDRFRDGDHLTSQGCRILTDWYYEGWIRPALEALADA